MSHFQWALQMILVLYNNDHFFFFFVIFTTYLMNGKFVFSHTNHFLNFEPGTHMSASKGTKTFIIHPKAWTVRNSKKKKKKKKEQEKDQSTFTSALIITTPSTFLPKASRAFSSRCKKKQLCHLDVSPWTPQKKLNIKIKRKKKFKAHEQAKSKIQRSRAVGAHVPTPYPCSEDKAFVNGTQNIFKDSITFWLKI